MNDDLRRRAAACLLLTALFCMPLQAQAPAATGPPALGEELPTEAEITTRLQDLEKKLGTLRQVAAPGDPTAELAHLERLDRLLTLQLAELRRAGGAAGTASDQATLQNAGLAARLDHPPPWSVEELDAVLDELDAARAGKEVLDRQIAERLRAVDAAQNQLDDVSRELRRLREQGPSLDTAGDPVQGLELEEVLVREQVRLRRLQLGNDRRELEVQATREQELAAEAARVGGNVAAAAAALETRLAELADRRDGVAKALEKARRNTLAAAAAFAEVQERLDLTGAGDPVFAARAETRRLELDVARAREEVLDARSEQIPELEELWRQRFQVLGGNLPAADRSALEDRLAEALKDLQREQRLVDARLEERRLALRLVEAQRDEPPAAAIRAGLTRQHQALESIIADYEEQRRDLDRLTLLTGRLLAEISRGSRIDLGQRLSQTRRALAEIWHYEIATADNRPITVGKVVLAIILMIFGYVVSRALSHRLGRSVFPRLGLASGAAAAFQTLIFYFLLVVFVLWSLKLVSIPLTVFTVLGGVVAIGVGFGSQNVVNNFISGLIILAERPIKVGDLIEVDGVFGKVERIGPRSSRIRSGDNTHIIVPNSVFLEKNVLNWTISDDVLRSYVDVGVAYGSPEEKVAELLERAVAEEPTSLHHPESEILFMDFGDDSLVFRAYFWLRVKRPLDRVRGQSRLRFRISALFREAGIVIAFPQRDVHLDSPAPLDVRLVGADRSPAGSPEEDLAAAGGSDTLTGSTTR